MCARRYSSRRSSSTAPSSSRSVNAAPFSVISSGRSPYSRLSRSEQLGQRFRNDGPVHRRTLGVLLDFANAEDGAVAGSHEVRPVEVDAEKVDRLRDCLRGRRPESRRAGRALSSYSSSMSAGYAPRSSASRNHRFWLPSNRRAAADVLLGRACGQRQRQVERDPDSAVSAGLAEVANDHAMPEQRVVRGPHGGRPVPHARRLDAQRVAEERRHPRLVVRDPVGRRGRRDRRTRAVRTPR